MNTTVFAVEAAEVLGAVALIVATCTIPAFADMALTWEVRTVFIAIEGCNRLSEHVPRGVYLNDYR